MKDAAMVASSFVSGIVCCLGAVHFNTLCECYKNNGQAISALAATVVAIAAVVTLILKVGSGPKE
jgi:hypothetical protein